MDTRELKVNESDLSAIIEEGNFEKLNEIAEKLGEYYASGRREAEKLSTSQLRHILDRLQRMKKFDRNQIQLLRPLLAYAAGKDKTGKLKNLQRIMDEAIRKVNDEQKFKNLRHFFEAIVAYHRYYGGKE